VSTVRRLYERKLAQPPRWLPENTHYETLMGSLVYGVSSDASDYDVYGFVIPPKEELFPHLRGEIPGFGTPHPRFEQYQQHHLHDPTENGGKGRTYDLTIYNIVKYFQLCMENNPNLVASLFTPHTAVLHVTRIGTMVREQRELFLHKGCWPKFKGYAYSQLHKMAVKTPREGSKRHEDVRKHGFDAKFAYHVVRLVNEVEQILMEGTLDLQRSREQLKAIRRGEWTEAEIRDYLTRKERDLEALYVRSTLREKPDEPRIRQLLLYCLEEHYGSLAGAIAQPDAAWQALDEIEEIIARTRRQAGS
jgi:uncharacterized protein